MIALHSPSFVLALEDAAAGDGGDDDDAGHGGDDDGGWDGDDDNAAADVDDFATLYCSDELNKFMMVVKMYWVVK